LESSNWCQFQCSHAEFHNIAFLLYLLHPFHPNLRPAINNFLVPLTNLALNYWKTDIIPNHGFISSTLEKISPLFLDCKCFLWKIIFLKLYRITCDKLFFCVFNVILINCDLNLKSLISCNDNHTALIHYLSIFLKVFC